MIKSIIKKILNENKIEQNKNFKKSILKYFESLDKSPKDIEIHNYAMSLGMKPDELESIIYELLFFYIHNVGKHNNVPDSKFNVNELQMGMDVEMEHTGSKVIAKRIAKDHLTECSDYYTRLQKMESGCKK